LSDFSIIVSVGLQRITIGRAEVSMGLEREGSHRVFCVVEPPGPGVANLPLEAVVLPDSYWGMLRVFRQILKERRPKHVELYLHTHPRLWVPYCMVAWHFGVPVVTMCTGGEVLYYEERPWRLRLYTRLVFHMSNLLVLKETYMRQVIERNGLARSDKLVFIPNKITVSSNYQVERNGRRVLFLNSFKVWRHPELIVQAIPQVVAIVPEAEFLFVGARSESEERIVRTEVDRLGVHQRVKIIAFDTNSRPYIEQASIFVLPADLIFCNRSLLEAMERGTPPIIADVDKDGHRIVERGESGLVVSQTPEAFATAIVKLLTNEALRRKLGHGAHKRVVDHFNMRDRVRQLITAYRDKVW